MKKIILLLVALFAFSSCGATVNESAEKTVSAPSFPHKMKFADAEVSFDRADMYERMDREIVSLTYGHTTSILVIKRAGKYYNEIVPILKKNGVPEDFFYLVATESAFDERAYSLSKAAGLWQFLAGTARQYGLEVNDEIDERYNIRKATEAACRYLKQGYKKYGCCITVASSYNAGMARIAGQLEDQDVENAFDLYLNKETSRYIFRIMAYKYMLQHPERFGFRIKENQKYYTASYKEVKVSTPVESWVDWAKEYGITYSQLREANQWIKSTSLQNKKGKTYIVRVPDKEDLYRSNHFKK